MEVSLRTLGGTLLRERVVASEPLLPQLRRAEHVSLVTEAGRLVGPADVARDLEGELTLVTSARPRLYATARAFCAVAGGELRAWGDPEGGGAAPQLRDVQEVAATHEAFAALLGDGTVVAWGDPRMGGDSRAASRSFTRGNGVAELDDALLRSGLVVQLCATWHAFLARASDGRVFTWGYDVFGADHREAQAFLRDKAAVTASAGVGCFAVLLQDHRAVVWQESGKSWSVVENVAALAHELGPFVCDVVYLLRDGSLKHSSAGAVRRDAVYDRVLGGTYASLALGWTRGRKDGGAPAWRRHATAFGEQTLGGELGDARARLERQGVVKTAASWGAMAALLEDGSVVAWGSPTHGGSAPELQDAIDLISAASACGFAALLRGGGIVSWGNEAMAWPAVPDARQVTVGSRGTFAAATSGGCVRLWGSAAAQEPPEELEGRFVVEVAATRWDNHCDETFAALCDDGAIVSWGRFGARGPDARSRVLVLEP